MIWESDQSNKIEPNLITLHTIDRRGCPALIRN